MSAQPLLSVLLPTHNGAAFLEQALGSVEQQEQGSAIEVIAVDDGSTDATLEILDRWKTRLQLAVYPRPYEGNWVANTNFAFSKATGKWISWLHQDDYWLSHRFRAFMELTQAWPQVDMFIHPAEFRDRLDRKLGYWRCPFPAGRPLSAAETLPKLILQNTIPIVSPFVRRDCLQKIGPMDETLWYFADWDCWLRLAAMAKLYYMPEPLAAFRVHLTSQTIQRTWVVDEIKKQFDAVTARAVSCSKFQWGEPEALIHRIQLARAVYLLMLGGFHARGGYVIDFLKAMSRVGPVSWWQYISDSRLFDRIGPRLRLVIHERFESCCVLRKSQSRTRN